MKEKYLIIFITVISLITHFSFFGHPNEVVFDEVHFGKFVSGYLTHTYFFDIHPPLGKLIIAGAAKIASFTPIFNFGTIGEKYANTDYLVLRFLPTLAGALLAPIIYLLSRQLKFSKRVSAMAGIFVAFENALLVQSRFILLDAFLLLFGFCAILFFLKFKDENRFPGYLLLSGIFSGLAGSIKWTGFGFLGLILIFYFIDWIKNNRKLKNALMGIFFLAIVPLLIYSLVFGIHFLLLTNSGTGDAFHSPEFQKTLHGSRYENDENVQPMNMFNKLIELNISLFTSNQGLTASHPYSSSWYTWPFMARPIFFWQGSEASSTQRIYSIGNPFVWWFGTFAVIACLFGLIKNLIKRNFEKIDSTTIFLLVGYFINFLPFIFIGRVMFIYHYLPALVFSILIVANKIEKTDKSLSVPLALGAMLIFLLFCPLSYGLSINQEYINLITWLKSWI